MTMAYTYTTYVPDNITDNQQLYKSIDEANFLIFDLNNFACVVFKKCRSDWVTYFVKVHHADSQWIRIG
jgi:hypothetical protein